MTEWPQILTALLARRRLQPEQTQWAMREILEDRATNAQIAAFQRAHARQGRDPRRGRGPVGGHARHATSVTVPRTRCSMWWAPVWDRAHTVNVSTMSSIVVAAAGARVVKHGNRAASSNPDQLMCWPRSVLSWTCPRTVRVPACRNWASRSASHRCSTRRCDTLESASGDGDSDVFSILGPLAEPARPAAALVGCAFRLMARSWPTSCRQGVRALVVRGSATSTRSVPRVRPAVWDATGRVVTTWFTPRCFRWPVRRSPLCVGMPPATPSWPVEVFAGGGGRDVVVATLGGVGGVGRGDHESRPRGPDRRRGGNGSRRCWTPELPPSCLQRWVTLTSSMASRAASSKRPSTSTGGLRPAT